MALKKVNGGTRAKTNLACSCHAAPAQATKDTVGARVVLSSPRARCLRGYVPMYSAGAGRFCSFCSGSV